MNHPCILALDENEREEYQQCLVEEEDWRQAYQDDKKDGYLKCVACRKRRAETKAEYNAAKRRSGQVFSKFHRRYHKQKQERKAQEAAQEAQPCAQTVKLEPSQVDATLPDGA